MDNTYGKWVHSGMAATSLAYLFVMVDKEVLIASSPMLGVSVMAHIVSVVLNAIILFLYYAEGDSKDVYKWLTSNWFGKGFNNLSNWSFMFASVFFLLYMLDRTASQF